MFIFYSTAEVGAGGKNVGWLAGQKGRIGGYSKPYKSYLSPDFTPLGLQETIRGGSVGVGVECVCVRGRSLRTTLRIIMNLFILTNFRESHT